MHEEYMADSRHKHQHDLPGQGVQDPAQGQRVAGARSALLVFAIQAFFFQLLLLLSQPAFLFQFLVQQLLLLLTLLAFLFLLLFDLFLLPLALLAFLFLLILLCLLHIVHVATLLEDAIYGFSYSFYPTRTIFLQVERTIIPDK
jgi:hypothetical protein